MRRKREGMSEAQWKLNMVAVIVLMIVYLIVTLYNSERLAAQVEKMSSHPFEMVVAGGELKMCIAKMQVRVERLYKHNTMDDVIYIRGILDELYEETDQVLKRLKHAYQGSDKEWDNLEDNLDEIKKQQNGFLLYVSADECFPQDQVIAYPFICFTKLCIYPSDWSHSNGNIHMQYERMHAEKQASHKANVHLHLPIPL